MSSVNELPAVKYRELTIASTLSPMNFVWTCKGDTAWYLPSRLIRFCPGASGLLAHHSIV
jgi:hypothetical protein